MLIPKPKSATLVGPNGNMANSPLKSWFTDFLFNRAFTAENLQTLPEIDEYY